MTDHRLDALSRLRETRDAIGTARCILLEQCIAKDASWADLSRLLRVSDKTVRPRVAEAIEALHLHQSGRAVTPPPDTRAYCAPTRR